MKALYLVAVTALLSGCAMSAGGLAKTDVSTTVTSQKSPKDFATCSAESMIGGVELRNDGPDHYWLMRENMYGIPIIRWDFKSTPQGSIAELRATLKINVGDEKVRACA